MKYFIGYKQSEDTYVYVNNIGSTVSGALTYSNAIDFLSQKNATNVCKFLNEYDTNHEYIVLKYEYSITEVE
jgi:hypothetical protein